MPPCLIGLGSNLGDRKRTLDEAVRRLAQHPSVRLLAQSRWMATLPVGGPADQSPYLNGAALVETSLQPEAMLELLQQIETALGRRRDERWGPRTIDLDLLLYDRVVLQTPSLLIPHPRMTWRRFVLEPAATVGGSMIHPLTGWTVQQHLDHLSTSAPYVAIAGPLAARRTELAEQAGRQPPIRCGIDAALLDAFYADPAGHARQLAAEFLRQWPSLLPAKFSPLPLGEGQGVRAERPDTVEQNGPSLRSPHPRAPTEGWSLPLGEGTAPFLSDFWFDEALAFADVWLPAEQHAEYHALFEQASANIVRPRLIVHIDVAPAELLQRISRRTGPDGCRVTEQQLQRHCDALLRLATRRGQGPLLRLCGDDLATALPEVRAAVEAMC
jgi:2-amino-4-hydroxy-6-hydroxymethyldihydropteridine diphosphokinase